MRIQYQLRNNGTEKQAIYLPSHGTETLHQTQNFEWYVLAADFSVGRFGRYFL